MRKMDRNIWASAQRHLQLTYIVNLSMTGEFPPNNTLHQTFDPLPTFAFAKADITSNAGELSR